VKILTDGQKLYINEALKAPCPPDNFGAREVEILVQAYVEGRKVVGRVSHASHDVSLEHAEVFLRLVAEGFEMIREFQRKVDAGKVP